MRRGGALEKPMIGCRADLCRGQIVSEARPRSRNSIDPRKSTVVYTNRGFVLEGLEIPVRIFEPLSLLLLHMRFDIWLAFRQVACIFRSHHPARYMARLPRGI